MWLCEGGSFTSLGGLSEGAEIKIRGSIEGQAKAATSVNWMHVSGCKPLGQTH